MLRLCVNQATHLRGFSPNGLKYGLWLVSWGEFECSARYGSPKLVTHIFCISKGMLSRLCYPEQKFSSAPAFTSGAIKPRFEITFLLKSVERHVDCAQRRVPAAALLEFFLD